MKRIISLAFFVLFINVSCSQDMKVNFENELTYIHNKKNSFVLYVSKKHPNLILRKNPSSYTQDFLYYQEKFSDYSLDENNEIEYEKLLFMNIQNKINKIVKSDKKEIINDFECEKYILESDNQIFEVFITKSKINNIEHLKHLFVFNDKNDFIFNSGLIVKMSNYSFATQQTTIDYELSNIKKSKKSIFVDFEKLNLMLNRTEFGNHFEEVEIIERKKD